MPDIRQVFSKYGQTLSIDRSIEHLSISPLSLEKGALVRASGLKRLSSQCALADWLASMGPRLLPSFLLPFSPPPPKTNQSPPPFICPLRLVGPRCLPSLLRPVSITPLTLNPRPVAPSSLVTPLSLATTISSCGLKPSRPLPWAQLTLSTRLSSPASD